MNIPLIYKNVSSDPNWYEPRYAHDGDSGFDAYAIDPGFLAPGERELVGTGWSFVIPEGFEIQVRPRSGLAWKSGITVTNSPGTVDSGYRDEVRVILQNTSDEQFTWNMGDRIAQLVVAPVMRAKFEEWPSDEEFPESSRNFGGFGSTGIWSGR